MGALPGQRTRESLGKGCEDRLDGSCARATRGRGLPSLDARTMENRQAALLILEGEDDGVFSRQPYMGMDRPTMKP